LQENKENRFGYCAAKEKTGKEEKENFEEHVEKGKGKLKQVFEEWE